MENNWLRYGSGGKSFQRRANSSLLPATFVLSLIADMPQLIVRNIEDNVVRKLKEQAGRHGISTEEEHRRILRSALLGKAAKRRPLKDYLRKIPKGIPDELFERPFSPDREVKL